jgi:hypothetical protein
MVGMISTAAHLEMLEDARLQQMAHDAFVAEATYATELRDEDAYERGYRHGRLAAASAIRNQK